MRVPSAFVRFAALATGIVGVLSCDGGITDTGGRFGSGAAGGPSGVAPIAPPAPGSLDSTPPIIVRISEPVETPIEAFDIGDSIEVIATLSDDRALGRLTLTGYKHTGDPDLGTFTRTARYPTIQVPVTGAFRPGLRDTTIRRFLQAASPLDTTTGTVHIEAILTDSAGNADTLVRRVSIQSGLPKVRLRNPNPTSARIEVPRGRPMPIVVEATHVVGVDSIAVQITGDATFVPPLNVLIYKTYPSGTTSVTLDTTFLVPPDAPLGGRITVTATAFDATKLASSPATANVFVRAGTSAPPFVTQVVPAKLEATDLIDVTVQADGGIRFVGVIVRNLQGDTLNRDSIDLSSAPVSAGPKDFRVPVFITRSAADSALRDTIQGAGINVTAFAGDASTPPLVGYAVRAGVTSPVTISANARVDLTRVTYGRTYPTPPSRPGVIGDIAVSPRGNVFLTNTSFNVLEVWQNSREDFARKSTGIAVGALPWGLSVAQTNEDSMFVANSGSTTISRVFIGTDNADAMREDLPKRIRTRENVIYRAQFDRNPVSGRIAISNLVKVRYSDRPQHVAQSAGGRLFFSTRPTDARTPGTIRWLDPSPIYPFPDPQQIHSYAEAELRTANQVRWTILNADSVAIVTLGANATQSDQLVVFDHPYGQLDPNFFVADSLVDDDPTRPGPRLFSRLRAAGSDVGFAVIDIETLALTDTTFVAASGDRTWIGFGEANTLLGQPGRLMMVNDPAGVPAPPPIVFPGQIPGFFSPEISVVDIVHNASEKVFGMAIDRTGLQVTAHGLQTYMAAVDVPFHLRLDGVYDSFDNGAGVAYHPLANSTLTANVADRVAFSATASGVIEIIDVAHYNNRGRLETRGNLYGPLRASLPLPGDNVELDGITPIPASDPRFVVLKLFGLTAKGLVVIDLRGKDILPGAP